MGCQSSGKSSVLEALVRPKAADALAPSAHLAAPAVAWAVAAWVPVDLREGDGRPSGGPPGRAGT